MVDNIYWLPATYGPDLIEYYKSLLKEPLPQRLVDLLAMLEEAARTEAGAAPDATAEHPPQAQTQAPPQELQPEAAE